MNRSLNNEEIHFGISRNKIHQGYALAGFLGIVGISFLTVLREGSPDALLTGLLVLIGSGVIGTINYRRDNSSKSLLVLNKDGLWYKDWKGPIIGWNYIEKVELGGSKIKASVRITLTQPDAVVALLEADKRPAFEKNPLITMPVLRIPAGSLDKELNEISDTITSYMIPK